MKYNPSEIEEKWQKKWEEEGIYKPDLDASTSLSTKKPFGKAQAKPFYNLMMFPYPSAEGMHVGNMYAFTGSDIYGRFKRMQGFSVFEPIGLDGFGIHSENYAIKVGRHPKEQAKITEANFYRQLKATGNGFDWSRTLETYDPKYYKWTQWIFIQLFKKGLAYRKKAPVNFCPSCKTVLADEQVIDQKCERCSSLVEKKELEQWFFKITSYADRLLNNLEKLNWTPKVKIAQKEWIGKKVGINIDYSVVDKNGESVGTIACFTTRPDTNFGATFVVLAPEHPFVTRILKRVQNDKKKQIEGYIGQVENKTQIERMAQGREKTGVFTGLYCINQLNKYKMPLFISDFVLMEFGTGAVVGVPGHDKRDFEFTKKFDLPVVRVVVGRDGDNSPITHIDQVQEEEGSMINSDFLNELDIHEATKKIMDYLEEKGWGKRVTTYHLRDWLISRQRYWGPPIPMIYCEKCNWQPVPEKDLPVLLPDVKDWKPKGTGKSPLANVESFVNTKCPVCKAPAKRETDVSDTFLDSAWYFFRYTSTEFDKVVFSKERVENWLPVHMYIGGAEHSVLHLLYSRFLTMVFHDLGLISFEEPYSRFYAHGLLIKDGAKMSKSKGNVVVPDKHIEKFGADTLRAYLMFAGPFDQGGDFRDTGIEGMHRFIRRVWKLVSEHSENSANSENQRVRKSDKSDDQRVRMMHRTVKEVTEDMENLRYNTAIAHLMEYYNFLSKQKSLIVEEITVFLKLLAPFAPHMTEELWQQLFARGPVKTSAGPAVRSSQGARASLSFGTERTARLGSPPLASPADAATPRFRSIHQEFWPAYDPRLLKEEEATIVVQVNGKVRDQLKVESGKVKVKDEIEKMAREKERVQKYLEGKKVKKVVYVEGKIINFVTN